MQKLLSVAVWHPVYLSNSVFLSLSSCHKFSADSSRLQQTFLCHYTELYYCIYCPLIASFTPSLCSLPLTITIIRPSLPQHIKLYYLITATQDHNQTFIAFTLSLLPSVLQHNCPVIPLSDLHQFYSLPKNTQHCPLNTTTTRHSLLLVVPLLHLQDL